MRRLRGAHGQATTEYVALVALVAVALALAAGLTSGGVGGGVLAGLQRGICRVAPVDCLRPAPARPDLAACAVERRTRGDELATTLAVLRLGTSGTLTVVRLSDGRVTVTLARGTAAGADGGLGARVQLGRRAVGGGLRASAGVSWAAGRSWTFPGELAARRFVDLYGGKATIGGRLLDGVRSRCSLLCDALGWRPHAQLPEPDTTFAEAGASTALTASFELGARVGVQGEKMLGRRIARDGSRTWYLRPGTTATAALGLPAGELTAGIVRETVLAYELDPRGRPRALHLVQMGELRGGASAVRRLGAERGSLTAGVGAVVELEATLDLREPAARAAAARLLAALADGGDVAALAHSARAVGRQIAQRGQIHRRTYLRARTTSGLGLGAALGAKIDVGAERTTDGLRLVAAETRLPGLPFLPRDDCRPR